MVRIEVAHRFDVGLLDRTLVRWAIRHALGQTVDALDQWLPSPARARLKPIKPG
jgi:hypothetical protein